MHNPFPFEEMEYVVKSDPMEDVYPQYRYKERRVPHVIYFPKFEVMIKMMRSCMNINNPKDLWCFQDK
jgi:hypothetical protein